MTTEHEQLVERAHYCADNYRFDESILRSLAEAIEQLEGVNADVQESNRVLRKDRDDRTERITELERKLAEARAETAAWERKFGGRTDYNEALAAPAPEPISRADREYNEAFERRFGTPEPKLVPLVIETVQDIAYRTPKSEAERRVIDEPCKHEWVPWVTEGRGGAIPRTPPLKCKKCDRFEKDILAAQQEPAPEEESGDAE